MDCQTKGRLDDEEDEGVAQNSSNEDGESIQLLENKKQGERPANQKVIETKDGKTLEQEKLLNADVKVNLPVDQSTVSSLEEASAVGADCNSKTLGTIEEVPDRPAEGNELSEEEKRKKNYEAEVKSWLHKRMQAPIAGTGYVT